MVSGGGGRRKGSRSYIWDTREQCKQDEWTGGATTPHPSMLRLIRIAAVLAAARPTLLFRPL